MRTWNELPSEHRKSTLRSLRYAAERAEVAYEGLRVSGPSVSRQSWYGELRRLDKEVTRAWADWASLCFLETEPIVCDLEECALCP